jgi:DNA-binding transcriptional LysR family regulator
MSGMAREDLGDLMNLIAIVDEGSFTRAAARLGLSQSALSHAIRRLEERMGLQLLARTTRSVAPTEAGAQLIEGLRPAFADIEDRIAAATARRDTMAGTIRITASETAARNVLWPAVDRLVAQHPEINIEIYTDGSFTDIVANRFDAGVRLGESVERDMVAVRIGPQVRMAVVAAPGYFAKAGGPVEPQDLAAHRCINMRLIGSGSLYIWEFSKDGREVNVKVDGPLTFNHVPMIVEAALAGHGIAYVFEDHVRDHLALGRLERVLEDWSEPFDGLYLYYPSRRQPLPAFTLLVEALRYRGD